MFRNQKGEAAAQGDGFVRPNWQTGWWVVSKIKARRTSAPRLTPAMQAGQLKARYWRRLSRSVERRDGEVGKDRVRHDERTGLCQ